MLARLVTQVVSVWDEIVAFFMLFFDWGDYVHTANWIESTVGTVADIIPSLAAAPFQLLANVRQALVRSALLDGALSTYGFMAAWSCHSYQSLCSSRFVWGMTEP